MLNTSNLSVVVLAAGQGSRMYSDLPKVLHPLAGKPLLAHVLDTAKQLNAGLNVVIGHGAEQVKTTFKNETVNWVLQQEQLGTGHAVAQALPNLPDDGICLVLYGDVPLIQKETLQSLVDKVSEDSIALLTVTLENPTGYGRIIRDAKGNVKKITEQKDACDEELKINEVNTGILACTNGQLKKWLPKLGNNNAQGEYYLTDVIATAVSDNVKVKTQHPIDKYEVEGVNNRVQLETLERVFQKKSAKKYLTEGVMIIDSSRFDVRGKTNFGKDVFVDVNCIFEGENIIGSGVTIGANCILINSTIADGVNIHPNSIIEDSVIGEACNIGPYARVRPGTELKANARLGNFVETKKSVIGEGSKVNHLTYIGDAEIGEDVNVGAGTITCNYDGANKSKTMIGDNAFIGSNSSLVAPVKIGKGATVGAGSTISKDVGDKELSIARGKQKNISGWKRPEKKQ